MSRSHFAQTSFLSLKIQTAKYPNPRIDSMLTLLLLSFPVLSTAIRCYTGFAQETLLVERESYDNEICYKTATRCIPSLDSCPRGVSENALYYTYGSMRRSEAYNLTGLPDIVEEVYTCKKAKYHYESQTNSSKCNKAILLFVIHLHLAKKKHIIFV